MEIQYNKYLILLRSRQIMFNIVTWKKYMWNPNIIWQTQKIFISVIVKYILEHIQDYYHYMVPQTVYYVSFKSEKCTKDKQLAILLTYNCNAY